MAGTPYWRERKFVTSSSLTNPRCTSVEPRRELGPASRCALSALSSWSDVMIFSLTRRSPNRCDIVRADPGVNFDSNAILAAGRGDSRGHGNNVSRPIVVWLTEIVNQPFPSKVHALTEKVTAPQAAVSRT